MKNHIRNSLTLTLMFSSIVLLLTLQILWLRNAYREAADNFRKETNMLFLNTVRSIQDTLIRESIIPYNGDTLAYHKLMPGPVHDSLKIMATTRAFFNDSTLPGKDPVRIQVYYINGKPDQVEEMLSPIMKKIREASPHKNFLIRLNADSLNADTLRVHYQAELAKSGIEIPFTIVSEMAGEEQHHPYSGLMTYFTRVSPGKQYAATFPLTRMYLVKAITPQIAFSAVLTLLILASFVFMYRNIRSQQKLVILKNEFIGNVTHELKTPVATVSVALEALKNFNAIHDAEKTSQYLDMAQKELARLNFMTDKILKDSMIDHKGLEDEHVPVDLLIIVQQVVDSMKPVIETRKTEVRIEKEGEDFTLKGSAIHLANIVYNLVDNALKYCGADVKIGIRLKSGPGWVELSVKDNGIGIAPENHKKIFEKYSRIPGPGEHRIKGYGLGLYYVNQVVKSHRGKISIDSKPGEGSCFTIDFPK